MVEKKKLKVKIVHVEPEKTKDGMVVYRMTLKTQKGRYIKGVKKGHWDNPEDRKSVKETWLREIGEIESREDIPEEELEAKAKAIEGEEIEEDE